MITDSVELYFQPADAASAGGEAAAAEGAVLLSRLLEGQGAYVTEALGQQLQQLGDKPADQQVVAQEIVTVGSDAAGSAVFTAVIAAPPGSSALRLLAKDGVQEMSIA